MTCSSPTKILPQLPAFAENSFVDSRCTSSPILRSVGFQVTLQRPGQAARYVSCDPETTISELMLRIGADIDKADISIRGSRFRWPRAEDTLAQLNVSRGDCVLVMLGDMQKYLSNP
eukprot:TRINITY_DN8509_c0_g3_i1.p1 TRINITY_DN8509_c0_g3~~TRINITY_DN8509_c0_g3_i1.p1  ORF type:complete len:117 (+),score=9.28 TRINITY_DN8509_c0_g3_i1:426-776(+)